MRKLDIVTVERLKHDKFRVGEDTIRVDGPTLIEKLYDRGVLGPQQERDKLAERRRDAGLWLAELYGFLYRSDGVGRYEPFSTSAKGYGSEMTDEEAELHALYHRYLRGLPAVVTQTLRFITKDQHLPRVVTIPITECLDKLIKWKVDEKEKRRLMGQREGSDS